MIYISSLAALFAFSLTTANRPQFRVKAYYIVFALLFAFSAFRYEVGCDWLSYFAEYQRAGSLEWSEIPALRQPIWLLILRSMHAFEIPYLAANLVSSAIFFVGVHILARRQPDPLSFLVLLFPILIINMPMSGIRQGAAIGLLCIAFVAFNSRHLVWCCIWVIAAAGFHTSAIVFLLLLPFAAGRYSRNRLMIGAVLALPGAYFLTLTDAGSTAISIYVGSEIEALGAYFRVGLLALTGLCFLFVVRRRWCEEWPRDYPLVSLGSIAMLGAALIVPVSTVIGDRFGYYLLVIQAIIISRISTFNFSRGGGLFGASPYIILFIFFVGWTQMSSHFVQCYTPYQSWLFGVPSRDLLGFSFF